MGQHSFYDLARRIAHSFRLSVALHRGEDTVGLVRLGGVQAGEVCAGDG